MFTMNRYRIRPSRNVVMFGVAVLTLGVGGELLTQSFPCLPPLCWEKIAPEPCQPNQLTGCMPTPEQCAKARGGYNGTWYGGAPGRQAVCLADAKGHVIHYDGGYVGGADYDICGAAIENDAAGVHTAVGWQDINTCAPASADPSARGPHGAVEGRAFKAAVTTGGGVVASNSAKASEVGIDMLNRGGNAMDAGVATFFAVGVTRPEMCGIGGGGFLVYRTAKGEAAALDFRETAPALIDETFDDNGVTGHRAVGVPGTVDGMAKAMARFGTMSLSSVIEPAASLAETGIEVSTALASSYTLDIQDNLKKSEDAKRIYLLYDGVRYKPYPPTIADDAPKLKQTDYAASLRLIARYGPQAFYADAEFLDPRDPTRTVPSIARLIRNEMQNGNGFMTMDDLTKYQAQWRTPLVGTYNGHHIIAMGPPSAGGIVTLEVLNLMEGYPLSRKHIRHSDTDYLHYFAEAQKIAWADRAAYVGDPDSMKDIPWEVLISKTYADARRKQIRREKAQSYLPGVLVAGQAISVASEPPAAGQTTHISVMDREGNAFTATCSLNGWFGTGIVPPGAGVLLNNHMLDFSADPRNKPIGGRRPRSSASPTIVVNKQGQAILAVGGAGGMFIPMGTILAVSNMVDYDMDVAHALDAPRVQEFDCSNQCLMLLEKARILPSVRSELRDRGHVFGNLALSGAGYQAVAEYDLLAPRMQAVSFDAATKLRAAASDPREHDGARRQER